MLRMPNKITEKGKYNYKKVNNNLKKIEEIINN